MSDANVVTADMATVEKPLSFRKRLDDSLQDSTYTSSISEHIKLINVAFEHNATDIHHTDSGIITFSFDTYSNVVAFEEVLENSNIVSEYEILAYSSDELPSEIEGGYQNAKYYVIVTLYDDEVISTEFELTTQEILDEAIRKIKVNSKGIKRIKMQCGKGFMWNGATCEKIVGADLANKRVSVRKMLINKKSQGSALKIRTIRKAKKAKRFRTAMGL